MKPVDYKTELENMIETFMEYFEKEDAQLCQSMISTFREYGEDKLADQLEEKLIGSDFYQRQDYLDKDLDNRLGDMLGK